VALLGLGCGGRSDLARSSTGDRFRRSSASASTT
jgi:hypothetical protein